MSPETDKLWQADRGFSARMKLARARQGWTQAELSKMCGWKPSARTISDWERGLVREPHLVELHRVATAMREDVLWLLHGTGDVHALDSRAG